MCPSQIACQSANTDPTVPPKDHPLPDISATAIIGRCTWAEVKWPTIVESGVAVLALCAPQRYGRREVLPVLRSSLPNNLIATDLG